MNGRIILPILLLLIFPLHIIAQSEGCTDRHAINYDKHAVINDGSCYYNKVNYKPSIWINALPDTVHETSGLIWWRKSYWTHNDSGGENKIYRLDSATGNVIQTITLAGTSNIDWEDIDQDDNYIYVADVGNNYGNRTDLVIYKLSKRAIPIEGDTSLPCDVIRIAYGDQFDFRIKNRANDFDCEAILSFGDSLYLFSKSWLSLDSRLYAVPKISGSYLIYPIDVFNANGLITGSTTNPGDKTIVLCGYKNYEPFIWILSDFWRNDFFGANKRRIEFPELLGTQTEGISYIKEKIFAISAERTLINKARIFKVDLDEIPY
ncbi:MAG: T9SS C-terminal target domain-containing protein [Omnitrophica WOR_2 bacterium]